MDTNLLVSAALFKNSTPRQAFELARFKHKLVTSSPCFDELSEVLFRPKLSKYIDLNEVQAFLNLYEKQAMLVPITCVVTDCRDPKDNKFLELALSAEANYIISGDNDLLTLSPYRDEILIMSPAQFLVS